jgi:hypothetical protein
MQTNFGLFDLTAREIDQRLDLAKTLVGDRFPKLHSELFFVCRTSRQFLKTPFGKATANELLHHATARMFHMRESNASGLFDPPSRKRPSASESIGIRWQTPSRASDMADTDI